MLMTQLEYLTALRIDSSSSSAKGKNRIWPRSHEIFSWRMLYASQRYGAMICVPSLAAKGVNRSLSIHPAN